ncbi:hypothetical protein CP532_2964 [Ophiocordyceps camponoti-leonardi (nom. inval.)]|nr:hypothetical protein CP532_2964 [Ophiocordyceps camponoti-leonardi (nom. inval.)]
MNWTEFHNIIAGKPRGAETTRSGISPLTGNPLWPVPIATSGDVDDCVAAAREAQKSWSRQTYESRVLLLERFAELYLDHAADFSKLLAEECGRTVENAAIEVSWAAQWLRYPSSFLLPEERLEDESKVVLVRHEPLGVVAAICPWNFPIMLAIGKIAPALATGNCVILKPSPFTPYTALKLVELAQQVFPPAVLQVLSGDDLLGPKLVRHPGVDKISFTGSSATGKAILKAGADQMKRITLETAGNNAAVILADVNLESVCPRIAAGLWFNAGQVCVAPRRLYVHRDVFDDFVDRLASATADLTRDLAARIGPVQNRQQLRRLVDALDEASDHEFVAGGPRVRPDGLFLQPSICVNPPADSRLLREENFGPIVCCVPFNSVDEAVRLANDVECGLAASVWSADADAAAAVASRLEAGNVFVNGPCRPDPCVPFGGQKQSGLGVEYGLEGLLSYCQTKAIYVIIPFSLLSPSWITLQVKLTPKNSHHFARKLHEQYGPIVVMAPGIISVADADEIRRIIKTEDWPKSEAIYGNFRQDPSRPTLLAYTDKKAYSRRKRLMSSIFGLRSIRAMEPLMRQCVAVAEKRLARACEGDESGSVVDMLQLIHGLAIDIIGITTFGRSLGVVENGSHPLPTRLKKGLKIAAWMQLMPWIRRLPLLPTRDPYIERFTRDTVDERRRLLRSREQASDLLQGLVEASDDVKPESEFRTSDVQDETVVLLTAGSETTANAELFTLLLLTRHPDVLQRLYAEVDAWYPAKQPERETDCSYSQAGMVYLQSCIDEAMRLVPGQATGSPREAVEDETILGFRLPRGTTVFPSTQEAHLDPRLWHRPHSFDPERWLRPHGSESSLCPFWPFSAGSRVCIGKHFALQEMHLTLVSLLRRFHFEHVPGQDEETVFRVAQQLAVDSYWMRKTSLSPAQDEIVNVNDVPMQGNGSYASNADLQREAALQALPLLRRAMEMVQKTTDRLTVVEYGSAHGNNTIEPLEAMLPLSRASEATLLLIDRPQNDFNTLANTVSDWAEARRSPLFLAMVPRSFYRPVVPARSVDVGFSLSCLHHLDRIPADPDLVPAQAKKDLCLFLRLRASEIVSGGSLVISLVGRSSSGRENHWGVTDACIRALKQMVQDERIPESVAAAFRVPSYERSVDEIRSALDEVSDEWETVDLQEAIVFHPAITELRSHQGRSEEASQKYAAVVTDWLLAVIAGYFLKAVQVGLPGSEYSEAVARELLGEWSRRTKQLFLEHHRDESLDCCYVHILLRRI